MSKQANPMWGGRFSDTPAALMRFINASIDFDKRLAPYDIEASQVHARMLGRQGIITQAEAMAICDGLSIIADEIKTESFQYSRALEDIHMNIESRLKELIGVTAGRLHTARSRNDQVATDFKLWLRAEIDMIDKRLTALMRVFLQQAQAGADMVMPGFTHLQVAQPVTWGHHMLAYVEMFARDKKRFIDARTRMNECPLGAAALAGTGFTIDRDMTAYELGFDRACANSLDAVSDRDFALEFLSSAAICATHLSRFAEELVIWSSVQFSFIRLSDKFSTGSSVMPQKKNPDAAELIRAKVGRITAALVGLLTVMKGLPLAYSKDMQEDKQQVFDAVDTLQLILAVMVELVGDIQPRSNKLAAAAAMGFSTATDLADWLVRDLGLAFRDAHHITGALVALAEEKKCDISELNLTDMQAYCSEINDTVFTVLGVNNSVNSRTSYGGTAPNNVRAEIARWQRIL